MSGSNEIYDSDAFGGECCFVTDEELVRMAMEAERREKERRAEDEKREREVAARRCAIHVTDPLQLDFFMEEWVEAEMVRRAEEAELGASRPDGWENGTSPSRTAGTSAKRAAVSFSDSDEDAEVAPSAKRKRATDANGREDGANEGGEEEEEENLVFSLSGSESGRDDGDGGATGVNKRTIGEMDDVTTEVRKFYTSWREYYSSSENGEHE